LGFEVLGFEVLGLEFSPGFRFQGSGFLGTYALNPLTQNLKFETLNPKP
jgi:hypothetical protein